MEDYIKISEEEAKRLFDEWLDEIYPTYKMGDLEFYPTCILKSDPIAYREWLNNWLDAEGYELE